MTIVNRSKPKIGLCMIVKDESHIIERCLNSVRPIIDFVLIEDTGSTDGTQAQIRAWLEQHQIEGQIHNRTWVDFAHNRSNALALLRQHQQIDYALIMDADDVLIINDLSSVSNMLSQEPKDAYRIPISDQSIEYSRIQLVSNHKEFYFRGVLHEFIEGPPGYNTGQIPELKILSKREGARSKDPKKYQRDALTLANALKTEEDLFLRTRYTFYLAQSLRDSGQTEEAIKTYLARSVMGQWIEETYISLLSAARLMAQKNYPAQEIEATLKRALEHVPQRLEAVHGLCRHLRLQGRYQEALDVGIPRMDIKIPSDGLFIEPWVYLRGLKDELAVCAYWAGHHELCLDLCTHLLQQPQLPEADRDRIIKNGKAAFSKLNEKAKLFTNLVMEKK